MSKSFDERKYDKVLFRLKKDKDGYPPDGWETLWAFEVEPGLYSLDNVPFFARGVSWGDIVTVRRKDDELHFKQVVQPSGNSVLRVIVYDHSDIDEVRNRLQHMGCDTEQSHVPSLISVDVPSHISLSDVLKFLDKGETENRWEYEEASVRHTTS